MYRVFCFTHLVIRSNFEQGAHAAVIIYYFDTSVLNRRQNLSFFCFITPFACKLNELQLRNLRDCRVTLRKYFFNIYRLLTDGSVLIHRRGERRGHLIFYLRAVETHHLFRDSHALYRYDLPFKRSCAYKSTHLCLVRRERH